MPYVVFGALYLIVAFLLLVALGRAAKRRVPNRFTDDVVPLRNPLDDEEDGINTPVSEIFSTKPENPFIVPKKPAPAPEELTAHK